MADDGGNRVRHGPPKVLHLLVGLTVGGIENQLLGILPRLQDGPYRSMVCSLKGDGPMGEEFRCRGVEVTHLDGRGKWDGAVLWRLYQILRAEKADILHCYTSRANWAGAVMGRVARVPVIVLSDREIRTWLRPWHRWLDRLCFGLAHGMVVPSRAIREFDADCLGLSKDRIWVIHNGVDVSAFRVSVSKDAIRRELGLDPRGRLAGYVGRLDESVKGLGCLLEALTLMGREESVPHLVVVGEGPSHKALREKVRFLALEDRVHFLGLRRDVPRVMRALDLLVQPSLLEGSPNAVLEAMAAGTPVVATRVGGIPELIRHGETGWLVPPGDPLGMAQAVESVLGSPEVAQSMARKAKDWVGTHRSMDMTANAFAALYATLMASGGKRPGRARPPEGRRPH